MAAWEQQHLGGCSVQALEAWATWCTNKRSCRSSSKLRKTVSCVACSLMPRQFPTLWGRRPLRAVCNAMGLVFCLKPCHCTRPSCINQREVTLLKCWRVSPFKADRCWVLRNPSTWMWQEQPSAQLWPCLYSFQDPLWPVLCWDIHPGTSCRCCNPWNNQVSGHCWRLHAPGLQI